MSEVWDEESRSYVDESELEKRKARRAALQKMGLNSASAEKAQDGLQKKSRSWSVFDQSKNEKG